MVKPCWKSFVDGETSRRGCDENGRVDGLLWYKDLGHHVYGQFSMAAIQANYLMEDECQLESGMLSFKESDPFGTFVGVYDGHGGTEVSRFIKNNFFCNLKRFATMHEGISENVIRKTYAATEKEFLGQVQKQWLNKPEIASCGSCCLVGIISNGLLYIANVGDSRVVLGRIERATKQVIAIQVSADHNANLESVRHELQLIHPFDPHIVVLKHNVWRVKGLIQVSRSIGDAYLKKAEFNREPLPAKYRVQGQFEKPILSSEPSSFVHKMRAEDQFLIFASDGLWEHLSNQKAVDIVANYARNGIARRLVEAALEEAASKREMRYSDLKNIERGVRRHFHDDISVVVLFLDPHSINGMSLGPSFSIKGGGDLLSPANNS